MSSKYASVFIVLFAVLTLGLIAVPATAAPTPQVNLADLIVARPEGTSGPTIAATSEHEHFTNYPNQAGAKVTDFTIEGNNLIVSGTIVTPTTSVSLASIVFSKQTQEIPGLPKQRIQWDLTTFQAANTNAFTFVYPIQIDSATNLPYCVQLDIATMSEEQLRSEEQEIYGLYDNNQTYFNPNKLLLAAFHFLKCTPWNRPETTPTPTIPTTPTPDNTPRGTIIASKEVNWNGWAPSDLSFTFDLLDESGNYFTSDVRDGQSVVFSRLPDGTYTLVERDPGTGWTISGNNQKAVIKGGNTVELEIVNTAPQRPTDETPDNGCTPKFGFSFSSCLPLVGNNSPVECEANSFIIRWTDETGNHEATPDQLRYYPFTPTATFTVTAPCGADHDWSIFGVGGKESRGVIPSWMKKTPLPGYEADPDAPFYFRGNGPSSWSFVLYDKGDYHVTLHLPNGASQVVHLRGNK